LKSRIQESMDQCILTLSHFDVSKPFRLNWDRIISSVFSIGSWYHCNCRLSALKASAHKKVGTYTQTGFNPTQVDSTLELNTLGCWSTHNSTLQVFQRTAEYTSSWVWFGLTTLLVLCTDCNGSCNSNYHTIKTTTTNNLSLCLNTWL
jgi:hypothetical protein